MNIELYKKFSQIYDECDVSGYSVLMGEIILKYFKQMHPDEIFKNNLDICCGTGELCNFLKENGINTKGVDFSNEMIDVAQQKYPEIEFVNEDIITYKDNKKYDFVTCFNDSLNHITDIESLKAVIDNIGSYLRKDGLFIFDINNYNSLNYEKYTSRSKDGRELTYHFHKNDKSITCDIEYLEEGVLIWSETAFEREYHVDEIAQILNDADFVIEICSQYFFEDQETIKWKFVTKKL